MSISRKPEMTRALLLIANLLFLSFKGESLSTELELEVLYHDVILSPKSESGKAAESTSRRTFKMYLTNKSNQPIKVLAGNKAWLDTIDGRDVVLSIRSNYSALGRLLAEAETDFRPIILQVNESCLIHKWTSVAARMDDIKSYRFEYAVDSCFADRFKVWAGSVVAAKAVTEDEARRSR